MIGNAVLGVECDVQSSMMVEYYSDGHESLIYLLGNN